MLRFRFLCLVLLFCVLSSSELLFGLLGFFGDIAALRRGGLRPPRERALSGKIIATVARVARTADDDNDKNEQDNDNDKGRR